MKWIIEKPEEDQTPNEQRFLWKYMIRSLGVIKNNNNIGNELTRDTSSPHRQERIRDFVERLQMKPPREISFAEEQFIRLYHLRRKNRKARRKQQKIQQIGRAHV